MIAFIVIGVIYVAAYLLYHRNEQKNPSPPFQDWEQNQRDRVFEQWAEAGYVPVKEGRKIVAKRPTRSLAWPAPKPQDRKG